MEATTNNDKAIQNQELHFIFKTFLHEKQTGLRDSDSERKPHPTTQELITKVSNISNRDITSGFHNVYLGTTVYDGPFADSSPLGLMLVLDVEAPKHNDREANRKVAIEVLDILEANDLTNNLSILASGLGFKFVWPYIIPIGFKEHLQRFLNEHENILDRSSHVTNKIQRLIGFRGNTRQGKYLNAHVKRIENYTNIRSMTPPKCKEFIEDGFDYPAQAKQWVKSLFPLQPAPEEWLTFLQGYKEYKQEEDIILNSVKELRYRNTARKAGTNNHLINTYLEFKGIWVVKRVSYGDTYVEHLSECPECGKKEGVPYVTARGRLKCRRRTCIAHEPGLSPYKWVQGYEGIELDPYAGHQADLMSLEEGRERISEIINRLIDGRLGDTIIKATPGAGKSHIALSKMLSLSKTEKVLYSGPTKELSKGALALIDKIEPGGSHNIFLLEGRNEENCPAFSKVKHVLRMGAIPSIQACLSCIYGRERKCDYYKQFDTINEMDKGLILTTHASAKWLDKKGFRAKVWVTDESPTKDFITSNIISLDDMLSCVYTIPGLEEFIKAVRELAERTYYNEIKGKEKAGFKISRYYATKAPKNPSNPNWKDRALWKAIKRKDNDIETVKSGLSILSTLASRLTDKNTERKESVNEWIERLNSFAIRFNILEWLNIAVGNTEGVAYVEVTQKDNKPAISFVYPEKKVPDIADRILVLDASAYHNKEVQSLFERKFHYEEINVKLPRLKTCRIKKGRGKWTVKKLSPKERLRDFKLASNYFPEDMSKLLIVAHQVAISSKNKDLHAKVIPQGIEHSYINYWGARGINEFENYDTVFCYGTPTINKKATLDMAMLLFEEEREREEFYQHQGESDLIQMLHRIRLVKGNKTVIVMGSHWPKDLGEPQYTYNMSDERVLQRLRSMVENTGIITKDLALLYGIGIKSKAKSSTRAQEYNWIRRKSHEMQRYCIDQVKKAKQVSKEGSLSQGRHSNIIPLLGWRPYELDLTPILISGKNWSKLLRRLRVEMPHLPLLSYKSARGRALALGSMDRVERLCLESGTINRFRVLDWKVEEPGRVELAGIAISTTSTIEVGASLAAYARNESRAFGTLTTKRCQTIEVAPPFS